MAETRDVDASSSRSSIVAALVIYAAVFAIPYVCGKAYRRWLQKNRPLDQFWDGLDRLSESYRSKRANVTGVGEIISDVMVEIARARSLGAR